MADEPENDNLENLKSRLYRKGEKFGERKNRVEIPKQESGKSSLYWKSAEAAEDGSYPPRKRGKLFWLGISALILLVIGSAVYFFFFGNNTISSRNIGIQVNGPTLGEAGKITNFNVFVENKNKVGLESADLIFDFPANTFSQDSQPITRVRFPMGPISAGSSANKSMGVVFLGQEKENKEFTVTLEYRLTDSNAIFAKSENYTFQISSPPIGLSLSLPKEINSKQEFNLQVEAVSNAETIIKNLSLRVDYPAGFQFLEADPKPTKGNNLWSIGDLGSFQRKEILIKGFVEGQDLDAKSFGVVIGQGADLSTGGNYGAISELTTIKKSPLYLNLLLNGQDLEKNISFPGGSLRGEIQWLNNLSVDVRDAKIELELKGNIIDESSISAYGGYYVASDKKIIWTSSSLPVLSFVAPGSTGSTQFNFSIKDPLPVFTTSDKDFKAVLNLKISGFQSTEQAGNFEVVNNLTKEIKVSSPLKLTPIVLHYSGPLTNSGPMPPKVNTETTYTVFWSLGGNSSDYSKTRVVASLPPYLRWVGSISPQDTDIKFNDRNNTVIWNVGDVPAGAGITSPAKEVAFQIGLTPSLNQVGSSPLLIQETQLESYNNFTEDSISVNYPSLNTILNYDEKFLKDQGIVVK